MIAGVDGCSNGWVVALEDDQGTISLHCVPSLSALTSWPTLELAVIDIPIGLTESTRRQADLLARRYLSRRGCTVFPAPYRAMLASAGQAAEIGQAEASRIRRELDGKGCSRQTYMILDKIQEAHQVVTPDLQSRLVEGHPEVSFAVMNGGRPMAYRKARRQGRDERLGVLRHHFAHVESFLNSGRIALARPDDILDAFAMLWTARRLRDRAAVLRLPDPGEPVTCGMTAQIVA